MPPEFDEARSLAVEALSGARTIGVVGHVGPDGDALGSMTALALSARASGREAVASFDEPFVIPDEMAFLDPTTLVAPASFPEGLDLAVVVDTSVPDRVGSLRRSLESARTLLVVDHHRSDGTWGDIVVLDPAAAATAELVYDLIVALGWPITEEVATALYTGIVTDTGRFQYEATTPRTHRIAAELLDRGVAQDRIGQKLFEEAPFGYYTVAARVLARSVLDPDHRFVWSMMSLDDLEESGLAHHQTDGLIDLVRMASGTEVACLLKERTPGTYKGSLRSRGSVDVSAIARSFGGGGHHNAAGFNSADPVGTIIEHVVAQLP